jgi:transposase-like protein
MDRETRRRSTGQATALRARMILMAAEGATNTVTAERLGIGSQHTVGSWRKRFASGRVDGLFDEPVPRTIGDDEIAEAIRRTLETMPADATHWSLSSLAKTVGLALSTDPLFVEKMRDVVGLYLNPPERAVVFVFRREEPDPSARPHTTAFAHASGASGATYP